MLAAGSVAADTMVDAEVAFVQVGADIVGEPSSLSGVPVALSADGDRVAIGAVGARDPSGERVGQVRVFDLAGATWEQVGADIDGELLNDLYRNAFGVSLAMSADGNRVAIGDWRNSGAGFDSGTVRVFDWDGTAWAQAGADIDGEAGRDFSGGAVALSADGNRVAIDAMGNDGSASNAGHVRVFDWDGTAWTQAGADIDGEAAGDASGEQVALSTDGNRLAIGARGNDGSGNGAGHVRVYDWDGTAWTQAGTDIDGEAAGDGSGVGVALSNGGARVAVGAAGNGPTAGIGTSTGAGHVRVYDWDGTAWTQAGTDIDGEAAGDGSGVGVAWSDDGNRLAIGAILAENYAGHVRVFDVAAGTTTTTVPDTTTTPAVRPPDGVLPETGGASTGAIWLFALLTSAGIALVVAARRTRSPSR